MLFTENAKKIIDSCRFCWMCRHICPIGNATGQERNTSRARALELSLVNRGAVEVTPELAENLYECLLCGACTKECVTGWDPTVFTREARTELAMDGLIPTNIQQLVDNFGAKGNVYGAELPKELPALASEHSEPRDTLLFLGETVRYRAVKTALDTAEVLDRAGIKYTLLENEPSSGASLDFLTAATDETKSALASCVESLKSFKTVICADPADLLMFTRRAGEWGIDVPFRAVPFVSAAADAVRSDALKPNKLPLRAAAQDAFVISRELKNDADVREIISACASEQTEFLLHGRDATSAGSVLFAEYMPLTARRVAEHRWSEAARAGIGAVVTEDPSEYACLEAVKPDGMRLYGVETLLLAALAGEEDK